MCTLRAGGVNFVVDEFLAESLLEPCAVFHKGEKLTSRTTNKSSDFNVPVSDAEFNDLERQIQDALTFLRHNEEELKRLVDFSGVEYISLDFPVYKGKEFFAQSFVFPPELLSLVGNLGIELEITLYPEARASS